MSKTYRVVPPLAGIQPASAYFDRIYTEVAADKPDHPSCYEGEWVCPHSPCPVRAVRVRVKAFFHEHLPRLRCPLCLRRLDFRHWLNVIALQEVPADPPSVVLPPCTKRRSPPRKRKKPPAPETSESSAG
jgi:hypothetical protein